MTCAAVVTFCFSEQAPRAKMNQQRSRRFRASKEGVELVEEKSRIREEILGRGAYIFRKLSILIVPLEFRLSTFNEKYLP
jgi:hypothetical protein